MPHMPMYIANSAGEQEQAVRMLVPSPWSTTWATVDDVRAFFGSLR